MSIKTMREAEDLVYQSFMRVKDHMPEGDDSLTRDISLTRQLLNRVGQPDAGGRFVLVTGSKGKGSTSRFIASLLRHHGYKIGLFTSPHLVHFTERIQVNDREIPEDRFVAIMNRLEAEVKAIDRSLPLNKYLGPIGVALTAALIYFQEEKTDINVIECGRGGRFDETNVLDNQWAVITPIMGEHLQQLGPTLQDVAGHKLGIVKPSTQAVFIGKQTNEVLNTMRDAPEMKGKQAYYLGNHVLPEHVNMDIAGTHFDVHTEESDYTDLDLPLLGAFQSDNAALAVKASETIIGKALNHQTVHNAFTGIKWAGRCEILATEPTVLLDGAINRESAEYLEDVVKTIGATDVIALVVVPEDKDYEGVIAVCSRFSNRLIVTEPEVSHKIFPPAALETAKKYCDTSVAIKPISKAIDYAKTLNPDLIIIAGTQTGIGEVKRLYRESPNGIVK